MRIVIDTRWIFHEISGIGAYTLELVRRLPRLAAEDEWTFLFDEPLLRDRTWQDAGLKDCANARAVMAPGGVFSLAGQGRMPGLLRRLCPDVYHAPNYMIPMAAFPRNRRGRIRCVVTVHDLIPLLFPEWTPRARKTRLLWLYRRVMREMAARADTILTVSETSRRDIERVLLKGRAEPGRVRTVYNGVSAAFHPEPRAPNPVPVLLYVGRFDPYKNLCGLLRAFERVVQRMDGRVRLRVIGPPDPRYPEAPRLAETLNLNPYIEWSGYVDGGGLARAYREADALAMLSLYEGFGLTLLEAMASGTPVVCSDRASLPEVVGDAALMTDPDHPATAAEALVRVLTDEPLRRGMIERGLVRAASFTWDRAARETLAAYRST